MGSARKTSTSSYAARLQAGEIVGNDLRQHWDHAIGKVDARAAGPGLLVERRSLLDEVRDVGDVHAQKPVAAIDPFQGDGVVKVSGIDRVDRHDHAIGQVATTGRNLLPKAVRLPAGLGKRPLWKRAGQSELVNDRERVDASFAGGPEHLDDHAFAVAKVGGKPHHVHDYLVVLADSLGAGITDRNRPGEIRPVDPHPAAPRRLEIAPDESGGAADDHLHDLARRPWPADIAAPGQPHADGVASGGVERGGRGNMNIPCPIAGGRLQRANETIAPRSPAKDAHHVVTPRLAAAAGRGGAVRSAGGIPSMIHRRRGWTARTTHGTPAESFRKGSFSCGP